MISACALVHPYDAATAAPEGMPPRCQCCRLGHSPRRDDQPAGEWLEESRWRLLIRPEGRGEDAALASPPPLATKSRRLLVGGEESAAGELPSERTRAAVQRFAQILLRASRDPRVRALHTGKGVVAGPPRDPEGSGTPESQSLASGRLDDRDPGREACWIPVLHFNRRPGHRPNTCEALSIEGDCVRTSVATLRQALSAKWCYPILLEAGDEARGESSEVGRILYVLFDDDRLVGDRCIRRPPSPPGLYEFVGSGLSGVPKPEPEWLGTTAAARRLGVTARTLYRFIDEGQIAAYRMGRVIRVRGEDLDAYIETRRIEPGTIHHLYPDVAPRSGQAKRDSRPAD